MSLILRVTYPATDGSMPEAVELEWSDEGPEVPSLMRVLEVLINVPTVRYQVDSNVKIPAELGLDVNPA